MIVDGIEAEESAGPYSTDSTDSSVYDENYSPSGSDTDEDMGSEGSSNPGRQDSPGQNNSGGPSSSSPEVLYDSQEPDFQIISDVIFLDSDPPSSSSGAGAGDDPGGDDPGSGGASTTGGKGKGKGDGNRKGKGKRSISGAGAGDDPGSEDDDPDPEDDEPGDDSTDSGPDPDRRFPIDQEYLGWVFHRVQEGKKHAGRLSMLYLYRKPNLKKMRVPVKGGKFRDKDLRVKVGLRSKKKIDDFLNKNYYGNWGAFFEDVDWEKYDSQIDPTTLFQYPPYAWKTLPSGRKYYLPI